MTKNEFQPEWEIWVLQFYTHRFEEPAMTRSNSKRNRFTQRLRNYLQ